MKARLKVNVPAPGAVNPLNVRPIAKGNSVKVNPALGDIDGEVLKRKLETVEPNSRVQPAGPRAIYEDKGPVLPPGQPTANAGTEPQRSGKARIPYFRSQAGKAVMHERLRSNSIVRTSACT